MKKRSNKTLKALLDRVFSQYIRMKYADVEGAVQCFTCNRAFDWHDVDAGHYISRRHLSTRYNEKNVHPQCKGCNRFRNGNMDEYALALLRKYGKGILEELQLEKNKTIRTFPYEEMLAEYTHRVENLQKAHGPIYSLL